MTSNSARKWKLPLIILAVAILAVILLALLKPTPPKVESQEKAWLVDVENIQIGAHHPHLTLLGRVESPFNTQLSSAIQADVKEVPVRPGKQVSKGEILVYLDKREIQSRVHQREADVSELKAAIKTEMNRHEADQSALLEEKRLLNVAKQALSRQERLKTAQLVAQERLEQAESQVAQSALAVTARQQAINDHPNRLQQLRAGLRRANAALNDALLDLERSDVRAPFDGIVTGVSVSPGQRVQVGHALVRLYDASQLEVRAQLPDKHLPIIRQALRDASPVNAKAKYQGEDLEFVLLRLAGQSNQGAGGVDAYFLPKSKKQTLILNSTLRLDAELPPIDQTFTLPISSVYGTNRIYRVEDERIQGQEVDIVGQQKDPIGRTRIIAKQGTLNAGDGVVTTQLPNAISGLKVELRENKSE